MSQFVPKFKPMSMRQSLTSLILVLMLVPLRASAAELIMFEQQHCEWCEAWNEDIGEIYGKTDEGKLAPLRRVDITAAHPEDLSDVRGANFTPTFALVEDGEEIGRIRGYPGPQWFFPMLQQLLEKLPALAAPEDVN